ncbi:MAG: winged helix-turn-helix domain-containing protein [Bryobacteraceae bacterium]|nr:winged helix-turn-helix domain-containing protein [Bryobacteraceae bacterium]
MLEIDQMRGEARVDGRDLKLTRKEFELLAVLVAHEGEILTREELMGGIWNYSQECRTRTLDVHVRRVRMKVGYPCIETVFGVGYRFHGAQQRKARLHVAA